jgi:hypothetical protein
MNIKGSFKEKSYKYNGKITSFDGYALDKLSISVELSNSKDIQHLIDLLITTKCCFMAGGKDLKDYETFKQ